MATNSQQPTKREEMWVIQLAKSKIVRAFAVSCELMLFLGGLWVTLTVNEPDALTWAIGPIVLNTVVMTAMGWAVDAALGESWLHVVIQHVKQETGMEKWSRAVAVGISLLFAANIVYALVARDASQVAQQSGGMNATTLVLFLLTALRIFIGFVYITVRECQGWITRHKAETASAPPALIDEWPLVAALASIQQLPQTLTDLQADMEKQLEKLASTQQSALVGLVNEQRLSELFDLQIQKANLVDLQVQRLFSEVQNLQNDASQPLDFDALTQHVMARLQSEFDARQKVQIEPVQEKITHQIDASKPRQKRVTAPKNDASSGVSKKILTMRQPSQSSTDKKERIHMLLDEDISLSSYRLASLVGCSEPTARRIKNEYVDMRHDALKASENDAYEEVILTHDA
jgi:hypothetical protein